VGGPLLIPDAGGGTSEFIWGVTIAQYRYNQKLAPDFFSFDAQ